MIELKYAENGDMDAACDEALNQIEEKSYVDKLKPVSYTHLDVYKRQLLHISNEP